MCNFYTRCRAESGDERRHRSFTLTVPSASRHGGSEWISRAAALDVEPELSATDAHLAVENCGGRRLWARRWCRRIDDGVTTDWVISESAGSIDPDLATERHA
ncbi:unnamed protein product [Lampetra planeri]